MKSNNVNDFSRNWKKNHLKLKLTIKKKLKLNGM